MTSAIRGVLVKYHCFIYTDLYTSTYHANQTTKTKQNAVGMKIKNKRFLLAPRVKPNSPLTLNSEAN